MVSNWTLLNCTYTIVSEVLYKHAIEQDEKVNVTITQLEDIFHVHPI